MKLKDYDEEMISKIFYLGSLEDIKITRFQDTLFIYSQSPHSKQEAALINIKDVPQINSLTDSDSVDNKKPAYDQIIKND